MTDNPEYQAFIRGDNRSPEKHLPWLDASVRSDVIKPLQLRSSEKLRCVTKYALENTPRNYRSEHAYLMKALKEKLIRDLEELGITGDDIAVLND